MIKTALKIAWKLYGQPYRWGGDDPLAGFDCSGFVIEILKSVRALPLQGDWTADGLYRIFKNNPCQPKPGAVVFFPGNSGQMRHVEFCLNEKLTIGASGGGSGTRGFTAAVAANAFVKVRPIPENPDLVFVDPFTTNQRAAFDA